MAKTAVSSQISELLVPLEQRAASRTSNQGLFIGVPKESGFQEKRVALTPQAVARLAARGHRVRIEAGAGNASFFEDRLYSEAGAEIVYDKQQLYECPIIVRVAPTPVDEWEYLRNGQILLSAIHLPTLKKEYLELLMLKRITSFAYEYLQDVDNNLPIVRSMSEIAGISACLIASECLSTTLLGKGKLLGGITGLAPTKVLILGAGTVGEYAAQAALGLGATVAIFDRSLTKLKRIQSSVGQRVFTSVLDPDVLARELRTCDVAIGAIHSNEGRSPMVVTEEMVMQMKPGSVIVDVSIDQGGCFETSRITTHDDPTYRIHDVIHYCVPNIPSRVSNTASHALSNILSGVLTEAGEYGGMDQYLWIEKGVRHGVYTYGGSITNRYLSGRFGLPFANLEVMARTRF